MGVRVTIKGDFRGSSVEAVEQYVRALVSEATGEQPGRVVHHGVVVARLDDVREQLQMLRGGGRQ